jgi:hypothetical protein
MASDPDTEVLRQWLDTLVKDADGAETKVVMQRRRV